DECDDVVTLARRHDDPAGDLVALLMVFTGIFIDIVGPYLDPAGPVALDGDVLAEILEITELPLSGPLSDVDDQVAVIELARQHRRPMEINVEVQQRRWRCNVEPLVELEEPEVDLQEREQLCRELAGHVEDRQRREQLFSTVGLELIEEVRG